MIYSKQTYVYKIVQDCQIQADVYRLPGEEQQPAILWLHGGGLIFGDRTMLRPEQVEQYLTAGYTVVAIDYRLAPETKLHAILEGGSERFVRLGAWARSRAVSHRP
jgi:acetyl esterase/lipase